ncbi:hypothetical protein C6496_10400 [Candidatus Poribacteria bacterium]|nr:MAG: hypothetical protein C6496_10400 [Candidatus Poribacteria bacterium]
MSPLQELKAPALRAYVGLITFSATSLAIGLGITLKKLLVFEYHSNTGVVGWLSANAYPKQQEYFFYLLALLGVPIVIGLYALGWHLYSHGCAKLTAQPVQRVLKANALASIPLWLCWLQVYHIGQWTLMGLILPMGLSLLIKLVLLSKRYFPNLKIASTVRSYSDNRFTKIASTVRSYSDNGLTKIASTARSYKIWGRGFTYLILPVFIYLLTYASGIHGEIDLFHEGERLAPLNEMLRGGIPFRDIYIQHGVFQNAYLAWIGGQLFEPTLFGLRSMEDILDPLGYVALYLLGLQVFRGGFFTAFICVVIASGTEFWVSPRHSLGLISFTCVASFLREGRLREGDALWEGFVTPIFRLPWKLLLSGLSASLAFWYSTEIGLYTLAAVGLFLLVYTFLQREIPIQKRLLPLISYSCGVLLGFLPVCIYFLAHGALDDVIWNSYIQCRYQLETWGLAFPSLSEMFTLLSTDGWHAFVFSEGFRWYLPIAVFLTLAAYLTYRHLSGTPSTHTLQLLLLLLGGIAFFRTALGRSDSGHLIYGATFLWLLCLLPLEGGILGMCRAFVSFLTGKVRWHHALKAAWVLIPIVIFSWYVGEAHQPLAGLNGKWQRLRQNPFKQRLVPEELARAGRIDIPDDQVTQIQKVVAYIQENTTEDEKIFDFTSQGAYYFFADRPGVTRFHQVSYASTPAMQQEVIAALEQDQTRLVLFKTGGWFDAVDAIPVEERHPLIAAYLQANYEPAININDTEILLRK